MVEFRALLHPLGEAGGEETRVLTAQVRAEHQHEGVLLHMLPALARYVVTGTDTLQAQSDRDDDSGSDRGSDSDSDLLSYPE